MTSEQGTGDTGLPAREDQASRDPQASGDGARASIRGTQSLVGTFSRCWQRPSLTGLEVLWRWVFGVPALWVMYVQVRRILLLHTDGTLDFGRLGLDQQLLADPVGTAAADPLAVSAKVGEAVGILLPDLMHTATWLVPVLVVAWVVVSSLGRTAVLRRFDAKLHVRVGTVMMLQALRVASLVALFAVWFGCLRWVANIAINRPIAAGQEPSLVLYAAMMIVATLGLFTGWAAVSWALTVAPLVAMLRNVGVWESLRTGFGLGPLKSKLVEVNLVLGIVKIALIILAIVFSATPLPFESVTTAEFLRTWWAGVTVLYFVESDFFHVVRLVSYLELWRVYEGVGQGVGEA
jgi:hypothetical protein